MSRQLGFENMQCWKSNPICLCTSEYNPSLKHESVYDFKGPRVRKSGYLWSSMSGCCFLSMLLRILETFFRSIDYLLRSLVSFSEYGSHVASSYGHVPAGDIKKSPSIRDVGHWLAYYASIQAPIEWPARRNFSGIIDVSVSLSKTLTIHSRIQSSDASGDSIP